MIINISNVHLFPVGTINQSNDGFTQSEIKVVGWDSDRFGAYLICKDESGNKKTVDSIIDHGGIGFKILKIAERKNSPWSNFCVDNEKEMNIM